MTVELLHVTHTAMRSRRQTNTFNSRQAFGYDFQVTTFSMPVYLILTFSFVGYAWPGTPKKQKQKKKSRTLLAFLQYSTVFLLHCFCRYIIQKRVEIQLASSLTVWVTSFLE